jgi:hypothetical protein
VHVTLDQPSGTIQCFQQHGPTTPQSMSGRECVLLEALYGARGLI